MIEILNARIVSTFLGFEAHGILTFELSFQFEKYNQCFGGFATTVYQIERILKVVGVGAWEALPNKTCRVRRDNDRIIAVGNIIKNDWFEP